MSWDDIKHSMRIENKLCVKIENRELAAYKKTDLTPEEITVLKIENERLKSELYEIKDVLNYLTAIGHTSNICKLCGYGCKENRSYCAKFVWRGLEDKK